MIRSPRRGLPRREPHRLLLGVQRGPGGQQRHAIVSPERGRLTYRSVVPTLEGTPAQASALQPTRSPGSGRPGPLSRNQMGGEARVEPTLRQACSRPRPRAQFAFKDSMIHIICNSHYVSHFAAFFIDTGAKISVVESCLWFLWRRWTAGPSAHEGFRFRVSRIGWGCSQPATRGSRRSPSLTRRQPHPSDRLRPRPDRRTDRGAGARSSGSRLFRSVDQRPKTS